MTPRSFYSPKFYRHLNHLVINGYYARELDADDYAFLEEVRVRGIANGSLPNTNTVLIEELEFWHLPYAIAPGVERRVGPVPLRLPETPEHRALRQARSNAWHARRIVREHNNAIAAAELERERREWEKANETRKLREMLSDEEWEAADPKRRKIKFGKVAGRHFVPQWKLDERGELNEADERKAKQERKRRERQARKAQENEEREARERRATEAMEELERVAKADLEHARQIERELLQQAAARPDADSLKQSILALLRNGVAMKFEEAARAIGCTDLKFMYACVQEMVRDGQLQNLGKKAA